MDEESRSKGYRMEMQRKDPIHGEALFVYNGGGVLDVDNGGAGLLHTL